MRRNLLSFTLCTSVMKLEAQQLRLRQCIVAPVTAASWAFMECCTTSSRTLYIATTASSSPRAMTLLSCTHHAQAVSERFMHNWLSEETPS